MIRRPQHSYPPAAESARAGDPKAPAQLPPRAPAVHAVCMRLGVKSSTSSEFSLIFEISELQGLIVVVDDAMRDATPLGTLEQPSASRAGRGRLRSCGLVWAVALPRHSPH